MGKLTPKQRVLRKWPKAGCRVMGCYYRVGILNNDTMRWAWKGRETLSARQAWASAARRLHET